MGNDETEKKSIIEKLGITPGPWEISELFGESNHGFFSANDRGVPHGSAWIESAYCGSSSTEESRANDNLIATSTEMLEALIEDMMHFERSMDIDLWGDVAFEILEDEERDWYRKTHTIIEKACYPKTWEQIKELL